MYIYRYGLPERWWRISWFFFRPLFSSRWLKTSFFGTPHTTLRTRVILLAVWRHDHDGWLDTPMPLSLLLRSAPKHIPLVCLVLFVALWFISIVGWTCQRPSAIWRSVYSSARTMSSGINASSSSQRLDRRGEEFRQVAECELSVRSLQGPVTRTLGSHSIGRLNPYHKIRQKRSTDLLLLWICYFFQLGVFCHDFTTKLHNLLVLHDVAA